MHQGIIWVQSKKTSGQLPIRKIGREGFYFDPKYLIRLLDSAFNAYGDLLPGCDSHGVVWLDSKMSM